jgi:uncharacterized protein YggE
MGDSIGKKIILILVLCVTVVLAILFIPWRSVNWGKIEISSPKTITVSGFAKTQQKSQIATFSVGVNSVKDKKEDAISEVNKKVEEVMAVTVKFSIDKKDIKTENLSIYQQEETYYEGGKQKSRLGQWRVSNNVSIILRDLNRASEFTTELFNTGATNVYGPNYAVDNQEDVEGGLLQEAVKNARLKAEIIAQSNGKKLSDIVSIQEGGISNEITPMYRTMDAAGGGVPSLEPGSSTISKTVTVIFELK